MAKKYSKTVEVDLETMEHEITEENVEEDHTVTEESPAEMETTGPETINGIIINSVHVRARREPNIESDVIELLRKGDHVKILGNVDGFYKVETFANNIAYILSDFVKEE